MSDLCPMNRCLHVFNRKNGCLLKVNNLFFIYLLNTNCLCGSVAKASDTQAVGNRFDPRPDH